MKNAFFSYIVAATGLSLSAAYQVLDYIIAGATVAGIVAAILSGMGIAIGTALVKKVIEGLAKDVAAKTLVGW